MGVALGHYTACYGFSLGTISRLGCKMCPKAFQQHKSFRKLESKGFRIQGC